MSVFSRFIHLKSKIIRYVLISVILFVAGVIWVTLSINSGRSQIMEMAGLAVAESSTKWNAIKDAAVGEPLTNGLAAIGLYVYDSATGWKRAGGDSTNGLWVNVKSGTVTATVSNATVTGTKTPADSYSNPTDAINSYSLLGSFNGTSWDRVLNSTHGDNLTTSKGINNASFLYGFDGTNWDRLKVTVHGDDKTDSQGLNVASFNYYWDGTNWDRAPSSTANSDGRTPVRGITSVSLGFLYNGSSWDMWRGDTTSGAWVNIKNSSLTAVGNATPSDDYSNPSNAIPSFALLAGYDGTAWDRVKSVDGAININTSAGSSIATNQVSMGDTATAIVTSNSSRKSLIVKNLGTSVVYLGDSLVTTSSGYKLAVDESITLDRTTAAVYGVCAPTESSTVSYILQQ